MFNLIFTKTSFNGVHSIKRHYKYIVDSKNKIIGGYTRSNICDLNGKVIASKFNKETITAKDNKTYKVILYQSKLGEIKVIKNQVYLDNEYIGVVEERERNLPYIFLMSLAASMLALTLLFVSIIKLPYEETPIISVGDKEGKWEAENLVGVLDVRIRPGSSGDYDFVLDNPHNVTIEYSFSLSELYNGEYIGKFPLEYRIKMNNILLGTGEWVPANELKFDDLHILPESSQIFTLEWRWPFEGDNELDTFFGQSNGKYQLVFSLTAESQEE